MICKACGEELATGISGSVKITAGFAMHDSSAIDLIITHENKTDGTECGASWNAFPNEDDGCWYNADGNEI